MKFRCLNQKSYKLNEYSIIPYREEDLFLIMKWRNDQMNVLRQNYKLTRNEQIKYYKTSILPTFRQKKPKQVLFSYLKNESCIGYGGLTNIDWINKRVELSFLVDTQRIFNNSLYEEDFKNFIYLMKIICFDELQLNRLFTETFEFRKFHISILEKNGFKYEGTLRQHVFYENKFINSIIHSIIKQDYERNL